jgi:hypothetical protein
MLRVKSLKLSEENSKKFSVVSWIDTKSRGNKIKIKFGFTKIKTCMSRA